MSSGEGEGWLPTAASRCSTTTGSAQLFVHPDAIGTGVGHALFEHVKTRRPDGFWFWVFQQNDRARRFYEAHGAIAVEFTDGAGNEEKTPDVRYEWRPPGVPIPQS